MKTSEKIEATLPTIVFFVGGFLLMMLGAAQLGGLLSYSPIVVPHTGSVLLRLFLDCASFLSLIASPIGEIISGWIFMGFGIALGPVIWKNWESVDE